MTDLRRVVRRGWGLVVVGGIVGAALAFSVTERQTPLYAASSQLFVAAHDSGSSLSVAYQGGLFVQQRVQSYAELATSPLVLDPVARLMNTDRRLLEGKVSAKVRLNTVLIDVTAIDSVPESAAALANAVSEQLTLVVPGLDGLDRGQIVPIRLQVTRRADVPSAPVSPRRNANLALGVLAGLVLGAGGMGLRAALDTSVDGAEAVTDELGIPLLGFVPYDSAAGKRPLITQLPLSPKRAEAFRHLRTSLQFANVDEAPRSIVVTSALSAEGKTSVACNLSISLAQAGTRVLLIEADLRRPSAANYLGLEGAVGLTSVLTGQVALHQAIQSWQGSSLSVLTSGAPPPNPSELLGSKAMSDLLTALEDEFDLLILDAPPLLPVTDAAVLAAQATGVVLVIRQRKTRRAAVKQAMEILHYLGAPIYGAVLNMSRSEPGGGEYEYRYTSNQTGTDA